MKQATTMAEIRAALMEARDEAYQAFQSSLIPTVDPVTVIGVRTPILRHMAKEMYGTPAADGLMRELPHAYFEESQLHAFLIEQIRDFDEAVTVTDAFLPYVDNWATCDQLSPRAFKGHGHLRELAPHIERWMASSHEYTLRFGIGMLLRYGLDEDFDPAYLRAVAAPAILAREEYYVRMMVAWFFATALAKQYDATIPYIESNRLPPWTHRKTIQKACESYRVTHEHKQYLRTLKA